MDTSPIRNRIRDMLGESWSRTDVGSLQEEAVLTSLLKGKLVMVERKPDTAPSTKIVRRKRLG